MGGFLFITGGISGIRVGTNQANLLGSDFGQGGIGIIVRVREETKVGDAVKGRGRCEATRHGARKAKSYGNASMVMRFNEEIQRNLWRCEHGDEIQ